MDRVTHRTSFYIGGGWTPVPDREHFQIIDPYRERSLGTVPAGTPGDVAAAVTAATAAQESWAVRPSSERSWFLHRIADGLKERRSELIELAVSEIGTPRAQAGPMQVDLAIGAMRDAAEHAEAADVVERLGGATVCHEPAGVVAAITPWNYPLYQAALKVGPALAAGCTVVLKPSEVACLAVFQLAEVADEAGLPPGVLNLITGAGSDVGEAMVTHPDVDLITFTGSESAGRRIAALAAQAPKPVALELGGKSASVVLDDGDLPSAVRHVMGNCLRNAGQTCAALSRLIVPRSRLAEAEQIAAEQAAAVVVGDPGHPATTLGPVASEAQRDRIVGLLARGVADGARLVTDPSRAVPERGWFVAPTVLSDVDPSAVVAQEEIFGPALVVLVADGDEEAVAVANGTRHGLSAAVWSGDPARARGVARRLRAGTVYLGAGAFHPSAPFGGYRGSGYGRERGRHGVLEFLQTKSYLT